MELGLSSLEQLASLSDEALKEAGFKKGPRVKIKDWSHSVFAEINQFEQNNPEQNSPASNLSSPGTPAAEAGEQNFGFSPPSNVSSPNEPAFGTKSHIRNAGFR